MAKKLTVAFCIVILILVLGNLGFSLILGLIQGRDQSSKVLQLAKQRLTSDFTRIELANRDFANQLVHDPEISKACQSNDHAALSGLLKEAIDKRGFSGFVTLVDTYGRIIISTDTPAKVGLNIHDRSIGLIYVGKTFGSYIGPDTFGVTGGLTLSSMVPILKGSSQLDGVWVVSQPLDSQFLIGEITKLSLLPDTLVNVELVLLNGQSGRLLDVTPGLIRDNIPFIKQLQQDGTKGLPDSMFNKGLFDLVWHPGNDFERDGRLWLNISLVGPSFNANGELGARHDVIGVLLISTPLVNVRPSFQSMLLLNIGMAMLALLAALTFSRTLPSTIDVPLSIITKKVRGLADGKGNVDLDSSSVSRLEGGWHNLDTAVQDAFRSWNANTQALKAQLDKLYQESATKNQDVVTKTGDLEALNRQFAHQAKNLTETAKQIGFANRQIILLQHKLDAILQSSIEAFLILDQFGNVLSANPVFLRWTGANEGEIAGRLCFDLVKRPGEPRSSDSDGQAFAHHQGSPDAVINQFYAEGVVYHKYQDTKVEVLAHLQPVAGDASDIQGYIMVLRDKSLRSEIAQLRSDIVTMLSESLRAPLLAAEMSWQQILRDAPQTVHPAIGQALASLHGQYEALLGMVDSLLMAYGGFVPPPAVPQESYALSRVIADALEEVAPLGQERQLTLDYKASTAVSSIYGDKDTVKEVLTQILKRMIEITAIGGRVRVESSIKRSEVRIGVSSSGPALPDNELAEMFAGFIPGKHDNETYGSRLAMYLVANNVQRMGGVVAAESHAGRGTSIYFTLPVTTSVAK